MSSRQNQGPLSAQRQARSLSLVQKMLFPLLVCGLIACSSCQSPSSNGSSQSVTLEFWTLQLDAFASVLEPIIAEFEQQYPHVRVKWVDVPFSEGPKRTLTAIMSDHVPDVVNLNPDFSAVLASRNALINMQEALSAEQQAIYLPVAWQAATLQQKNGATSTFGLPWYVTSSITLYNQDLLQRAGLSAPPDTYDALPAFAQRIREKTGAYGLMPVIAENGNFLKELHKMGIRLYDAQGTAIFATEPAIRHLERFVEMYRQGWVPAEAITESHRAAVGRYQAGTLAMFQIGPNFLKIVQENAPSVYQHTAVAPQFPENAQAKDFSLMLVVVPRKSAHPKEAVAFAQHLTNAKNQLALAQAAPVLPSITQALQDPYFSAPNDGDRMAKGRAVSAAQLLKATNAYQIKPNQNTINEIINHHVQLAMLGKQSAAQALRQAQQEINDTLKP